MNVDLIRKRLSRGGGHLIRTSDGREYRVPHPEFAMVGRHYVVIEEEDGFPEIIDPLHVVAIRKAPSGKTSNGGS